MDRGTVGRSGDSWVTLLSIIATSLSRGMLKRDLEFHADPLCGHHDGLRQLSPVPLVAAVDTGEVEPFTGRGVPVTNWSATWLRWEIVPLQFRKERIGL